MNKLKIQELEKYILRNIMLTQKDGERHLLPLQFQVIKKLVPWLREDNNWGEICGRYVYVFDEVGCGKTIEAGIAIWEAIRHGAKHVLIVAPGSLTHNWYTEMLSKFGITFQVLSGTSDYMDLFINEKRTVDSSYKDSIADATHFYIVSNRINAQGSNAALDRIKSYGITWDLVVIDEGHENKNEFSKQTQALMQLSARSVIFMSATPIKNLQDDFKAEQEVVQNLLNNYIVDNDRKVNIKEKLEEYERRKGISFPEALLQYDEEFPFCRIFKETMQDMEDFKVRQIVKLPYDVDVDFMTAVCRKYDGTELDQKRGCIMQYVDCIDPEIFSVYAKGKYEPADVEKLRGYDNKLDTLIRKVGEILGQEENSNRILIFCEHRRVNDYLRKVFTTLYGAECVDAFHGERYDKEERKKKLFLLNTEDEESREKKIIILSHKIGSTGFSFSLFNHVFQYELPYTPADLEQRLGRIDRVTNRFNPIFMYYFEERSNFLVSFDSVYINRIIRKFMQEVLPVLPSKNLIVQMEGVEEKIAAIIWHDYELYKKIKSGEISTDEQRLFEYGFIAKETEGKNIVFIRIDKEKRVEGNKQYSKDEVAEYIGESINNMLKQLESTISLDKITDKGDIESAALKYVTRERGKISYKNKFGETCRLTLKEVNSGIKKGEDYEKLLDFIQKLEQKVSNPVELTDELCKELADSQVRQEMVFSVLYGIWKAENKKRSLKDVIRKYNEIKVFADIQEDI